MDYYNAFPFYAGKDSQQYTPVRMGYLGYGQQGWGQMVPYDRVLEDLEYLQQMYPSYAKKYQGVVSNVADKMDYEGSFIYDQYPDKLTIIRMVESVMKMIQADENSNSINSDGTPLTENAPWSEKEPWIRELVTVLMYNEILMRRRKKNKYFY